MGVYYRRADNSRPVSFTASAWEWLYATNLSPQQRETSEREREREREDRQTDRNKLPARRSTQCTNNSDPITSTSELLEAKQCHCACSPILGSPTCVWPLRNKDPQAKICRPTYTTPPLLLVHPYISSSLLIVFLYCAREGGLDKQWSLKTRSKWSGILVCLLCGRRCVTSCVGDLAEGKSCVSMLKISAAYDYWKQNIVADSSYVMM
jgi:hypothetical protein